MGEGARKTRAFFHPVSEPVPELIDRRIWPSRLLTVFFKSFFKRLLIAKLVRRSRFDLALCRNRVVRIGTRRFRYLDSCLFPAQDVRMTSPKVIAMV